MLVVEDCVTIALFLSELKTAGVYRLAQFKGETLMQDASDRSEDEAVLDIGAFWELVEEAEPAGAGIVVAEEQSEESSHFRQLGLISEGFEVRR